MKLTTRCNMLGTESNNFVIRGPLFPFTEEAVRRWVGKTDRGRPLTLRVLNKHLSEKIRQSSNCYTRDGNDVGQMNLAQLRTLLDDCMRPDHNCGRAEHG